MTTHAKRLKKQSQHIPLEIDSRDMSDQHKNLIEKKVILENHILIKRSQHQTTRCNHLIV